MNFKEVVSADVERAFLNPDEFGEALTIEGIDAVGVWSDEAAALSGLSADGLQDVNSFGLVADERMLHLPEEVIPVPMVGQRLNIDGECWLVKPGIREEMGMLTLKLMRVYS